VVSLTGTINQFSHLVTSYLVTYYILGLIDVFDCLAVFNEPAETSGSASNYPS